MNYDLIFQIANAVAMITWLFILLLPKWKYTFKISFGFAVILLSLAYTVIVAMNLNPGDFSSFSTLEGVMRLFTLPGAALAGWIHYLAFDIMVGLYILRDSQVRQINHLIIIPSLIMTFMLGPIGLLMYFAVRYFKTRNFPEY